jgi:DNA-binding transcriptional LysR family regulator
MIDIPAYNRRKGVLMELHHLRTFVIVAEEQNVTKAAKRLYMTPPAISAHIKALEEELNVTLFVRTSQGMHITEKGELLRAKAEQTLRAARDLVNQATQMQSYLIGTLSIGLNSSPAFLRIAPLITEINVQCSGIELAFHNSVSGKIIDSLINRELDAGFIFNPSPVESITTRRLALVDLVIAAPKQWKTQLQCATWADIAQLPWICSSYYCPFQTIIDDLFANRNLDYRRVVQSEDDMTKMQLVSAGVGVALLERSEAEHAASEGKLTLWQHEPIQSELHFGYLWERQADPLMTALESVICAIWHDER